MDRKEKDQKRASGDREAGRLYNESSSRSGAAVNGSNRTAEEGRGNSIKGNGENEGRERERTSDETSVRERERAEVD